MAEKAATESSEMECGQSDRFSAKVSAIVVSLSVLLFTAPTFLLAPWFTRILHHTELVTLILEDTQKECSEQLQEMGDVCVVQNKCVRAHFHEGAIPQLSTSCHPSLAPQPDHLM